MPSASSTTLRIRELILQGLLKPGERVKELDVAERLGISRTPIRAALPALAKEGLLVAVGARGFAVRRFSHQECIDALRARAALEGLAAKAIAMRADRSQILRRLKEIVRTGDEILDTAADVGETESRYAEMNDAFHLAVLEDCGAPILVELVERCNVVPFVSPAQVAFEQSSEASRRRRLDYAHGQHHGVVDAIAHGDGARAEALFREHAYTQESSLSVQPAAEA